MRRTRLGKSASKGRKTVGYKWVFILKYKADRTIDKHKARLVAKGFTQTYGVDYSETFFLVVKLNTVKVIIWMLRMHS